MDKERVIVENLTEGHVGINLPNLGVRWDWPRKGAKVRIEREKLIDAFYDYGVENMFRDGILDFDDLDLKKEVGLEEDEVETVTATKFLKDAEIDDYLTKKTTKEFSDMFKALKTYEQKRRVADRAIEICCADMNKCRTIEIGCGVDVIDAIRLNKENKGDDEEAK